MHHKHMLRSDLWQARLALLGVLILQWLVQNHLHLAGRRVWILSALELLLLLVLAVISEVHVSQATSSRESHLEFSSRWAGLVRVLAMVLFGCVLLVNMAGLVRLIASLLVTNGPAAQMLLANAVNLFATNVIVSGLWYWELDRGGPYCRYSATPGVADFLFPQMTLDDAVMQKLGLDHWRPRFLDYLYIAFTNAMAFSPTDTLPLSRTAKMLMLVQATVSLLTIAIVAARAVNILGS